MNILFLALGYFLFNIFKNNQSKNFLQGINFEKIMPLVNMLTSGDATSLLESDIFKNSNFLGIDLTKVLPIIELVNSFINKSDQSNLEKPANTQEYTPNNQNIAHVFPLEPINDIANKSITYSLSQYLTQNKN